MLNGNVVPDITPCGFPRINAKNIVTHRKAEIMPEIVFDLIVWILIGKILKNDWISPQIIRKNPKSGSDKLAKESPLL